QPFAVAQIDENDAAVIAARMHPAGERDGPANVRFAKRVAVSRAIHGAWKLAAACEVRTDFFEQQFARDECLLARGERFDFHLRPLLADEHGEPRAELFGGLE